METATPDPLFSKRNRPEFTLRTVHAKSDILSEHSSTVCPAVLLILPLGAERRHALQIPDDARGVIHVLGSAFGAMILRVLVDEPAVIAYRYPDIRSEIVASGGCARII